MKAVLVDDERLARRVLRKLLERDHPDVEIVAEADGVASAAEAIALHAPDLVFLDVQLAGEDGFSLFDRASLPRVIFVTAWDRYAVRAFEVHALDYLLKPVAPDRLAEALRRAREPEPAVAEDRPLEPSDLVCLPTARGMRFFRVHDVTHLTAADDYSEVHLANGGTLLAHTSMTQWEARLPEGFLRVHRSVIANVDHVDEVLRSGTDTWEIRLKGGGTVPMSRRHAAKLLERHGGRLGR